MGKSIKILVFFLVLVLMLIIFADSTKKKPIDWTPTYGVNDKIPFGLKVFNVEAEGLFKNQKIEKFSETPYEFFYDVTTFNENDYNDENSYPVDSIATIVDSTTYSEDADTLSYEVADTVAYDVSDTTAYETTSSVAIRNDKRGALFSVSDFYKFDDKSTEELLYFVEKGNTVFISATTMPDILRDSLNFEIILRNHIENKLKSTLVHSNINFEFDKGASDYYFSKFDKKTTTILGNIHDEKYTLPNFIEIKYGEGKFLLHLQPIAFTNYYLLKNNHKYIEAVCAHIDSKNIYWNADNIFSR